MTDLSQEISRLIRQEIREKNYISPKEEVSENDKILGCLSETEIATLSALLKTKDYLSKLKLRMLGIDYPYNWEEIKFYESLISGLESVLINSLLDNFIKKTKHKDRYKIKKGWQIAIDTS